MPQLGVEGINLQKKILFICKPSVAVDMNELVIAAGEEEVSVIKLH